MQFNRKIKYRCSTLAKNIFTGFITIMKGEYMQVTLNAQNNNQTNFTSLKKVNCGKLLSPLIGEDGFAIEDKLVQNLNANKSFQTLCEKYDVFVNVAPHARPAGIMLDKGLSIEILASKIKKGGIFGFFMKNPPRETISGYMAAGVEARTWNLAEHIIDNFIKAKDGMEADINKFLEK